MSFKFQALIATCVASLLIIVYAFLGGFGNAVSISNLSYYVLDNGVITSYNGSQESIILPTSYSVKEEKIMQLTRKR